jgi:hypothetical protein
MPEIFGIFGLYEKILIIQLQKYVTISFAMVNKFKPEIIRKVYCEKVKIKIKIYYVYISESMF